MIRGSSFVFAAAVSLLACKDVAETVVEKGIKSTKETAKGIEEGVDK